MSTSSPFGCVVCLVALVLLPAAPSIAQDQPIAPLIPPVIAEGPSPFLQAISIPAAHPEPQTRPAALVPLYGSLAALNALDVHSTLKGLATGTVREANPLMRPFVRNQGAFIALKAATTATAILLTEKSRKKHPRRAVVIMFVTNAAMAAVVAHNYRAHRR